MGILRRSRRTISTALAALALVASWSCGDLVRAVSRDYTIDMSQSSIAISGTVFSADLNQTRPIVEQGPGSLTSKYTGTLITDREIGSIALLTGSSIDANVNGNWRPLADASDGTAPADYGGRANFTVIILPVPVYFAGRDLAASVTSGATAVNGSSQFSLGGTTLTFTGGNIAYRASSGDISGAESIVGEGGTLSGNGTLGTVVQGGRVYETLTVPVNASFQFGNTSATINLTLTGQIHATYLIPASNGDYNQNGIVDAADYIVWRETSGQSGVGLAADGNGDNQVNTADFSYWRSKFGQTVLGSGSTAEFSGGSPVPEPSTALLFGTAMILGISRRRR
jgi:hypothetical protein